MSDIFWDQTKANEWRWSPAKGYEAIVTKSLGDGTWSFRVNNTGRCDLPNNHVAFGMAEAAMKERIDRDFKTAIAIIARLEPLINK